MHDFSNLGLVGAAQIEDFISIEAPDANSGRAFCYYVSKNPIWPYEDGDFSVNYAKQECESLGLILAPTGFNSKLPLQEVTSEYFTYIIQNTMCKL